ncbi:BRO1 domain-containing protein BROX [Hypsibius exemplaris]|uniref:BRO1 domain-containing protein BROX n=1 Tax=Hypsibius exemplaris TaxID=2072580 RepID=A0A1W0XBP1_HYPEX|nr:BRO1 domain-containing protein BROX [Hypsibius exemplaris]
MASSFWFHRNPIKASAQQKFDPKGCTTDGQALRICGELRQTRTRLLEILAVPAESIAAVVTAYTSYIALLQGLIQATDERGGESKLRFFFKFKWTSSLDPEVGVEQQDALFDLIHISITLGLWYMKHAALLAANEKITAEDAKEVHRSLRLAAGIFQEMQTNYTGRLLGDVNKGSDTDPRILLALISQCTAEAQEVTLARAVEMKHTPSLISALANETAKMFSGAEASLSAMKDDHFTSKWVHYLRLKASLYEAFAYCYSGESLLAGDQCGPAVRALQESDKLFSAALAQCKEYNKAKGVYANNRPEEATFFRPLKLRIGRILEKCDRENGMIYHQKVPVTPPTLELKATYGLVSPEQFSLPPVHPEWTAQTYKAFDLSRIKRN